MLNSLQCITLQRKKNALVKSSDILELQSFAFPIGNRLVDLIVSGILRMDKNATFHLLFFAKTSSLSAKSKDGVSRMKGN